VSFGALLGDEAFVMKSHRRCHGEAFLRGPAVEKGAFFQQPKALFAVIQGSVVLKGLEAGKLGKAPQVVEPPRSLGGGPLPPLPFQILGDAKGQGGHPGGVLALELQGVGEGALRKEAGDEGLEALAQGGPGPFGGPRGG